ncbi:MAG: glycosyltransferase [Acidimicrobiales bacterium]
MTGRPIRVAQVVTTLARGGAQATVMASSDMAARGIEVTVVSGPDVPPEGVFDLSDRSLVTVPDLHRAVHPVSDAAALWWLTRWLRLARPDLVHTHSSKAGLIGRVAARRAGIPVVHTVHGWSFAPHTAAGARSAVTRSGVVALERWAAGWTEALVVVTSLDAEVGLAAGIGDATRYHLIRSGIDLTVPRAGRIDRDAVRARLGLTGRFVVGSVGRLAEQKDPMTLVAGFARAGLADAVLVIVGDGPMRSEVVAAAERAGVGDQVLVLGHRDDAAGLLGAFDLFVSTARWEGLPRSLIEAVAAQVPVAVTGVGGVAEVVEPGRTGRLLPVGSAAAVARAIVEVHDEPEAALRMAARAAGGVAQFDQEQMRSELADLWRGIAGGRPRSTRGAAGRAGSGPVAHR